MTNDQSHIETHYTSHNLIETIIQALEKEGVHKHEITRTTIAAIDEFHVRGQEVSHELAVAAGIQPGSRALDVGCGLGGACRLLADEFGCNVTGIDITVEYIRTAQQLSELLGLQHSTHFVHGSALELPFSNNSFDIVWTQHVQMNIADKPALYAEIERVLAANGRFIYYDILGNDHAPIHFPVPWASDASLSYLITSHELRDLLHKAGLQSIAIKDETEKGIASLNKLLNRIEQKGLPAIALHLLMGDNAINKLHNMHRNLIEKRIVLESGLYRRK